MYSGIIKCAFYDPATGTTVQLSHLATDTVMKIREPYEIEDAAGANVYAGDDSEIEITSYDSYNSQLATWMAAETELNFVAYGIEQHILWYENCPISVKKNLPAAVGGRNSFTVKMTKKGGQHDIHAVKNLALGLGGWPTDANSNGIVDSLTKTLNSGTDATYSILSSLYQRAVSNGTGQIDLDLVDLVFPISGVPIAAYSNIYNNENTFDSATLYAKNFAGATLSSDTSNVENELLELTTPSGIYSLTFRVARIDLQLAGSTATDIAVPFLGTDSTNYSNINY